jgi:hypothetical protein
MDWDELRQTRKDGKLAARGLASIARAIPMFENSKFSGGGTLTGSIEGVLSWKNTTGMPSIKLAEISSWHVSDSLSIKLVDNLEIRKLTIDPKDLTDWVIWLEHHHAKKQER